MPVKTWTSEKVTSADINAYLTNSGYTYITNASFGPIATLAVNSIFTSTYPHYKIIFAACSASAAGDIRFRVRKSGVPNASNYNSAGLFQAGTTVLGNNELVTTGFRLVYAGIAGAIWTCEMDLHNPQVASQITQYMNRGFSQDGTNIVHRMHAGYHSVADSYDGFDVINTGGGTVSGTYIIYGLRTA